jgi:hypothetical protein
MRKITFSRHDIEMLCDRLEARAWSGLFMDMPGTQADIRSAAALLRLFVTMGIQIMNGLL